MRRVMLAAAAALAAVAVFVLASLPPAPRRLQPADAALAARTAPGAFHVHTTASDGAAGKDAVAAAAARAGLRFVVFTDHGDGTAAAAPPEYLHGVLCIEGVEISTTGGHYAAIGMAAAPYPLGGEPSSVVEDVARLGGFGVVTHPVSAKAALAWGDWSLPFDAVEWMNTDSEWRDERRLRLGRTLLDYLIRPAPAIVSMLDRPVEALARWDTVASRRRVLSVAGHDAHGGIGRRPGEDGERGWRMPVPSYEASFRAFSTNAVLDRPLEGNAATDARRLVDALRAGRSFTSIDGLAGPAVLDFSARRGGEGWLMGEAAGEGVTAFSARATVPGGAAIALLHNGNTIAESQGGYIEASGSAAGTYRVEVRAPHAPGSPPVPWLLSNPIFLLPRPVAAPAEAALTADVVTLAPSAWRLEKEPSSSGTISVEDSRLRLRYRLGQGSRRSQYVAAAADLPQPLGEYDSLVFEGRADRPMRLSVQLRFESGGDSRWKRSVYLDTGWRRIVIPVNTLVPAGAPSSPPDWRQARSVLLVVDLTNARPGEEGTVTVGPVALAR